MWVEEEQVQSQSGQFLKAQAEWLLKRSKMHSQATVLRVEKGLSSRLIRMLTSTKPCSSQRCITSSTLKDCQSERWTHQDLWNNKVTSIRHRSLFHQWKEPTQNRKLANPKQKFFHSKFPSRIARNQTHRRMTCNRYLSHSFKFPRREKWRMIQFKISNSHSVVSSVIETTSLFN